MDLNSLKARGLPGRSRPTTPCCQDVRPPNRRGLPGPAPRWLAGALLLIFTILPSSLILAASGPLPPVVTPYTRDLLYSTNSAQARLKLGVAGLTTDTINVLAAPYNCKGDGVSDDTAGLQAALNAADGTVNPKVVYVPAGLYMISAPLKFAHPGTLLRGVIETNHPSLVNGWGRWPIYNAQIIQTTPGDVLQLFPSQNICRIENIELWGNGQGVSTGACIRATGGSTNLSDLEVNGVVMGEAQYGLYLDAVINSTFDHVTFYLCANVTYATGHLDGNYYDCRENSFRACNADENWSGFSLQGGPWNFTSCKMGMAHAAPGNYMTNTISLSGGAAVAYLDSCEIRYDGATNGSIRLYDQSSCVLESCYFHNENGGTNSSDGKNHDYLATLWGYTYLPNLGNYLEIDNPVWGTHLSNQAIAVTSNSIAQRVYATPDTLTVNTWDGHTVNGSHNSDSRFSPNLTYTWGADQHFAPTAALFLGPPVGTYGGALYFSGWFQQAMLRAELYRHGDFALLFSTNLPNIVITNTSVLDPVKPLFYVDSTNNMTVIGHNYAITIVTGPSTNLVTNIVWYPTTYSNTLTVEGTFNATGQIYQNGVPIGTGSGSGLSGTIDVTQAPYNCVGNGIADCTAGLQQALNDGLALSKSVWIPDGVYVISSNLVMSGRTNTVPGIGVIGNNGRGRTILVQTTPGQDGLVITNGLDDTTISSLDIRGPGDKAYAGGYTNGAAAGIRADDGVGGSYINMLRLMNCNVQGFGVGIYASNSASMLIQGGNSTYNGIGVIVGGVAAPVALRNFGCTACATNVMAFSSTLSLSGCDMGWGANILYLYGVQADIFQNNFEIGPGGIAGIIADNASRVRLVDNRISDQTGGATNGYTCILTNLSQISAFATLLPTLGPSLTRTNVGVAIKADALGCRFDTDLGNIAVTTPYGDYTAGSFWTETAGFGTATGTNSTFNGIPWRYAGTNADEILNYKYRTASGNYTNANLLGHTKMFGLTALPVFANNAAAVAGGLNAGQAYRTGADPDPIMVVH